MERLTHEWDSLEYACNVDGGFCCSENLCDDCELFDIMLNRLGRYEDTGLEPEDVQKVADFMKLFPKLCEKYILNYKEEIV